jgi:hypothetical protein
MTQLKVYRFRDLKDRGLVNSWAQLQRMIRKYNFPMGRMLTPQCRVWTPEELEAWLASRPVDGPAFRGVALQKRGRPRAKAPAQAVAK